MEESLKIKKSETEKLMKLQQIDYENKIKELEKKMLLVD